MTSRLDRTKVDPGRAVIDGQGLIWIGARNGAAGFYSTNDKAIVPRGSDGSEAWVRPPAGDPLRLNNDSEPVVTLPSGLEVPSRGAVIDPRDYGLLIASGGESSTDLDDIAVANLTALQTAVTRASETGATIHLPGGAIWISDTWRISAKSGLKISGCGEDNAVSGGPATVIMWRGATAAGKAIVELDGCRGVSLRDMRIQVSPSYPCEVGLSFRWNGSGVVSTACEASGIIVDGHSGYIYHGVRIWKDDAASDSNNSEHMLCRIRCLNYGNRSGIGAFPAGFANLQGQAKAIKYLDCQFVPWTGDSPGLYGYYGHGSGMWMYGGGGANDTDFFLTAPNDAFVVQGFNSETSERFLATGGSSAPGPISITGCRINGSSRDGTYGWQMFQINWPGPFTMCGNLVQGASDSGGVRRPAYIKIGVTGQPSTASIRGNMIMSLDGSNADAPAHPLVVLSGSEATTAYSFTQNAQQEADAGAGPQWADKVMRPAGSTEGTLT